MFFPSFCINKSFFTDLESSKKNIDLKDYIKGPSVVKYTVNTENIEIQLKNHKVTSSCQCLITRGTEPSTAGSSIQPNVAYHQGPNPHLNPPNPQQPPPPGGQPGQPVVSCGRMLSSTVCGPSGCPGGHPPQEWHALQVLVGLSISFLTNSIKVSIRFPE